MSFADHPQRLWWRKLLFQVHLWIGVLVGLYVVAISLSGSVLVFERNLLDDVPQVPQAHKAGPLSWGRMAALAQARFPGSSLSYIDMRTVQRRVVSIGLRQDGRARIAYVDSVTGRILAQEYPRQRHWLVEWMEDFHNQLAAGATGAAANGVGGALLFGMCLTGIVLWWPGKRRWAQALRVRWNARWPRVNFDLHSAFGFWCLVLISMWGFANVQSMVQTQVPSYASVDSTETSIMRPVFNDSSLYAQDSWQLTSRLTLNYGIRWDYDPPPTEQSGHPFYTATNLNDPANAALAPEGTPLWQADKTDFQPRAGFSWMVRDTSGFETVLRGGTGIFYGLGDQQGAQGTLGFPYSLSNYLYGSAGTYPLSQAAAPIPFTLNPPYSFVFAFDPHLEYPRTYMWNVSVQQALGQSRNIQVTYVGNLGRNLLRNEMLTPAMGGNANFQYLDVTTNNDHSNYNGLQVEFQQNVWKRLQALASYTWSHALDNGSNVAWPIPYHTIYAPSLDYGNSDYDIRNSFNGALTYQVPGTAGGNSFAHYVTNGWAFDSLFRSNSAATITITTGVYSYGLIWNQTAANQRPNVVPGRPFYLHVPSAPGGRVINAAAFSTPSNSFSQGDLARNALRGFGVWQEDCALRREFPIHDQVSLLFRAEAFNAFNHPLFGDVGINDGRNILTNPYFGISSQTLADSLGGGGADGGFSSLYQIGAPRSLQFAMKLRF